MALELWHNPRCSKSRQAKELVDAAGVDYVERRYLDAPPTAAELEQVLVALGKEPWEITRLGEDRAKELGMKSWDHDRAKWIDALVANPVLIERPILVRDDGRAVLGRPPEDVKPLL
jgi:arsenate reductase